MKKPVIWDVAADFALKNYLSANSKNVLKNNILNQGAVCVSRVLSSKVV